MSAAKGNAARGGGVVCAEKGHPASTPDARPQSTPPAFNAPAWLMEHYPAVFGTLQPLALGIHHQIEAEHPELSNNQRHRVRGALKWFTHQTQYLRALAAGQHRVALDGTDAGPPTPEHMAQAQGMLDGYRKQRERALSKPAPKVTVKPAPVVPAQVPVVVVVRKRPLLKLKARTA